MTSLAAFAGALDSAAVTAQAMPQLSEQTFIGVEAAYEIQRMLIGHREARGERVVGIKLGFTSREKIRQMGVGDLIWGRLTDAMIIEDGGSVDPLDHVHPRVEPDIAFLLRKPLAGRVTLAQAGAAIQAVAPAVELIDSRYRAFQFNLSDVIADNCSSSGFVVGPWSRSDVDVSNLGMLLEFNGRAVQWGSSAAILGHPLRRWSALPDLPPNAESNCRRAGSFWLGRQPQPMHLSRVCMFVRWSRNSVPPGSRSGIESEEES